MTAKEKVFLEHYIESGDVKESAIKAGYSPDSAESQGYFLRRKLENEIREKVSKTFGAYSAEMAKIIRDLAKNSTNEQTKFSAAKDTLDRAGYRPPDKVEILDNNEPSDHEELMRQVGASLAANPQVLVDIMRQDRQVYLAVLGVMEQIKREFERSIPAVENPGSGNSETSVNNQTKEVLH